MSQSEPVSRTHVSQGLKLHYADWGNPDAPLLLLVHGMKDHARSWDWTAVALRDNWHVVAPDLRGHGDSQWSADGAYFHAFHVMDIADLIDSLGHERATIVGHSFGGNVCGRYAALFPHKVSQLVLVDALGPKASRLAEWHTEGPVGRTRDWILKRREVATKKSRRLATLDEAVSRMAAANRHLSEEQSRHLAVHGVRKYEDGYGWKYDPFIGTFLPEDFAVDITRFWRDITAPTLLCWGTESWTAHPDEEEGHAKFFQNHRTVVFNKAGHWLHHDQLDTFVEVLNGFICPPSETSG